MRSFSTFLLLPCFMMGLSSAIRGERRRLQVEPLPEGKEAKCRPLPKADPKSGSPTSPPSTLLLPKGSAAPAALLPYCPEPLPKAKKAGKADCLALGKGALPKDFDGTVVGYLKVDLSYDDAPAKVLAEVSDVLQQETSAVVAGCHEPHPPVPVNRQLQTENATESVANETTTNVTTPAAILGVNFTDITIGGECTPANKTLNCSVVSCDVTILYSGEANATEEAAMLALLKAAIEAQAAQGSFATAGVVGNVSTGSTETDTTASESKSESNPTIIVIGAVAGALVLVGALFAGYKYSTRPKGDRSFGGEPVWTGVVSVAEAVQDSVEATMKKVTGKAV